MPDDPTALVAIEIKPAPVVGECILMRFVVEAPPELRRQVLAGWGLGGVAVGGVYGLRCSRVIDADGEAGADFVLVPLPVTHTLTHERGCSLQPAEESPDAP